MKNFIFKSSFQSDLDKMFSYLKIMAGEQRAQRSDLREIKRALASMVIKPELPSETAEELGFDASTDTE